MIEVEIKVQISDPTLIRKKFAENQGSYKFSLIHEEILISICLKDSGILNKLMKL